MPRAFDQAALQRAVDEAFAQQTAEMQPAAPDAVRVHPRVPDPASPGIGPWPYAALAAGQAGDVASTLEGWGRGLHEQNGIYGGNSAGRLLAIKAPTTIGLALLMRYLSQQGPKARAAAKGIGYGMGAVGGVSTVRNELVGR